MASIWITVDAETGHVQGCAGYEPLAFLDEHEANSYINDEPYLALLEIELREVKQHGGR